MPGFRSLIAPDATEKSAASAATLPSTGTVGVPTISPTQAHGRNIVGIRLLLTATLTWSVAPTSNIAAGLINDLKFVKSADKKFDLASFAQLNKSAHIYSGATLTDVAFGASGVAATFDTGVIPLHFTTDVPIQITLTCNNYASVGGTVTAGNVSFQAIFHYAQLAVNDDKVVISTAAAQQNSAVDINIGAQFPVSDPVVETWIDVGSADTNLSYASFKSGQTTVYDKEDSTDLKGLELYLPNVWNHITGFLLTRAPTNVIYLTPGGQSSTLNQLVANFASALTPTYYIVLGK